MPLAGDPGAARRILRNSRSALATAINTRPLADKKILAVDESPSYRELRQVLQGESYDLSLARIGEEALELLTVQAVDCILLDVHMPGIGGFETCRRIKSSASLRDVPVILFTSGEDRNSMLEGMSAGADDCISKMAEVDVLIIRQSEQIGHSG